MDSPSQIGRDDGFAIAVYGGGNVYLAVYSLNGTWDTPVNPYARGGNAFAAKVTVSTVNKEDIVGICPLRSKDSKD
jgi:hypothetical protein